MALSSMLSDFESSAYAPNSIAMPKLYASIDAFPKISEIKIKATPAAKHIQLAVLKTQ